MEGKVKFFNKEKRFGFIQTPESERDIFVHEENLNGVTITDGDEVTFETKDTEKGKTAINVVKK